MTKHSTDLDLLFQALADPTRRGMVERLALGPAPVSELARPSGLRLPTVMRHLAVLEDAGLVVTAKDGRVRTCAIVPEALAPMNDWLYQRRAEWDQRLDRLEEYVATLMKDRSP
jgi:DNA-binding transcriptional ArsR family regulator